MKRRVSPRIFLILLACAAPFAADASAPGTGVRPGPWGAHPGQTRPGNVQLAKAKPSHAQSPTLGSGAPRALRGGFLGGVVEGFYGPAWSVANTLSVMRFLQGRGMNTFVYAPKGDPYARAEWRNPYPASAFARLRSLVEGSRRYGLHFVYSVSPGLDITYSSAADRAALVRKVDQVRAAGVNDFLLSFDDIAGQLNPRDSARYRGSLAWAESSVANFLWRAERRADPRFRLILLQTQYYGLADNAFWKTVRNRLLPPIDVVWTGPGVLSAEIRSREVRRVSADLGHRLVIWDNYPVNDFSYVIAKRPALFLGPLTGRGDRVPSLAAGYWFNPMLQPLASEIPLWTCAAYLRDPRGYRPARALEQAVRTLGGRAASALEILVENSSSRYYEDLQPARLRRAAVQFWRDIGRTRDLEKTPLYQQFEQISGVAGELQRGLPNRRMFAEMAPWARALSRQGQAGALAVRVLAARRSDAGGERIAQDAARLERLYHRMRSERLAVGGTVALDFVRRVLALARGGGPGVGIRADGEGASSAVGAFAADDVYR